MTLLPAPPVLQASVSTQEESLVERLNAMQIPDKEMSDILNLQESLTLQEMLDGFDVVTSAMTKWLETAHLCVFTLEQNIKKGIDEDTQPVEDVVNRMDPLMGLLVEMGEAIEEKEEQEELRPGVKLAITKIQSEWSGLQHFLTSVKKSIETVNEEKELRTLMDDILLQIDDLSIMIFQFQERRHAAAIAPSSPPTPSIPKETPKENDDGILNNSLSNISSADPQEKATTTTPVKDRDNEILEEIDARVEPLFNHVQKVYARMTTDSPLPDTTGVLGRKHRVVQERWECLRIEIDELKEELKEDRWLVVFRQVADQVDVMIDGLDKTVGQCYAMIHQAREWHAAQTSAGTPTYYQSPSKSILKSAPKSYPSNASVSSSSSTGSMAAANGTTNGAMPGTPTAPTPVDPGKFRSVEKNFEAKYKYCAPSIANMLAKLGHGIATRVTRNNATIQRHEAMVQRWNQLRISMDELRIRDLPDTEKLLMMERPISPAWSRLSDRSDKSHSSWNDGRYRSPEPNAHDPLDHWRNTHALSPYSKTLTSSPTSDVYNPYDEVRRGRSVTPSSGRDSSMWRTMHHNKSPSPVYGRTQRTASPLSGMRDLHAHVGSMLRPSSSDSSSVGSSPSVPGSNGGPGRRTKTPTNPRRHASSKTSRPPYSGYGQEADDSDDMMMMEPTRRKSHSRGDEMGPGKKEASFMKPTKSTLSRKQAEEKPLPRSKTPNPQYHRSRETMPNRPKSSMGLQGGSSMRLTTNHPRMRAETPVRRTGTPSLIPRPKTPSNSEMYRSASPSLIPRPRSSMLRSPPPTKSRMHGLQVVSNNSDDPPPSNRLFLTVPDSSPPLAPHNPPLGRPGLRKKYSTPVLSQHQRAYSPISTQYRAVQTPPPPPPPSSRQFHSMYYSHDEEDEELEMEEAEEEERMRIAFRETHTYVANAKDPLDVEVGRIVNASPITIKCQRGPHSGQYYFGNELSPSGNKIYTCKLMTYSGTRRGKAQNKVLIRVGGGWQELEIFLLEHANLMASDVVVRSFCTV